MNRVFEIISMEEDFDQIQARVNAERQYKNRPDYFSEMEDADFVRWFRLSKSTYKYIVTNIRNHLDSNTERNYALSAEIKVLLALRFYASGSFLTSVADFCGVSVSSASRAVKDVSYAIASLAREYIKFQEPQRLQQTVNDFYQIAKFPKVIGAIGCTHVRIQSPGGDTAELFRNRKGYSSLKVQAVCNANLQFQDVVARWPGSTRDSTIFNNSRVKFRLENQEFQNYYILGDSGYKVCEYMMTPLVNPITEPEKLYNESQIRTRNVIERCFGIWKRRFPVLSMGMRVSVDTVMAVIVACAVLHNIAIQRNEPDPPIDDVNLPPEDGTSDDNGSSLMPNNKNARARSILIANYFATL